MIHFYFFLVGSIVASFLGLVVDRFPEHAFFKDLGRVEYVAATDDEAVDALLLLTRKEGILPAIESSHDIAEAVKRAPRLSKDKIIIVNVSGRGDKDVAAIADYLEKRNMKNQE